MGHPVKSPRDRDFHHRLRPHGYRHGCLRVHCQNYHLDERVRYWDEVGHQRWSFRLRLSHLLLGYPCLRCCLRDVVDLPMKSGLFRL